MKKYLFLLILLCGILLPTSYYGASEDLLIKIGPTIRNGQEIQMTSDRSLYNDWTDLSNSVRLTNDYGQIKVNGQAINQISTQGSFIGYKDNKYRGDFVFLNSGTDVFVCNRINLEDYIRGVIPYEMSASFPLEALKAQAVASRGFALSNKNKYMKYGYNLDDTTNSQVYKGMKSETSRTNQAVDETRGIVPFYMNNYAETIFHATSGGYTVAANEAWGGRMVPYLVAIEDPYSVNTRAAKWTYKISRDKVKSLFEKAYPEIGSLEDIQIQDTYNNRRVKTLSLMGSRSSKTIKASEFRSILGNTKVKSTWFTLNSSDSSSEDSNFYVLSAQGVKKQASIYTTAKEWIRKEAKNQPGALSSKDDFVVQGRGYGHGVGMSQYGAVEMAKQGKNYRDILLYYYPAIELRNY